MRLKNFLIVVQDIDTSVNFYKELFGMNVLRDFDGNVIMTDGLVLQDKKIWEGFIEKPVTGRGNDVELYFETKDIDAFQAKLDLTDIEFEYVNKMMEHSWGQKVIRIYDPDGHIIEVGEEFDTGAQESEPHLSEVDIPGSVESFIKPNIDNVNLDALFEVEADHKEELVEYMNDYAGTHKYGNVQEQEAPDWEDYWDDQPKDDEEDVFAEENY